MWQPASRAERVYDCTLILRAERASACLRAGRAFSPVNLYQGMGVFVLCWPPWVCICMCCSWAWCLHAARISTGSEWRVRGVSACLETRHASALVKLRAGHVSAFVTDRECFASYSQLHKRPAARGQQQSTSSSRMNKCFSHFPPQATHLVLFSLSVKKTVPVQKALHSKLQASNKHRQRVTHRFSQPAWTCYECDQV